MPRFLRRLVLGLVVVSALAVLAVPLASANELDPWSQENQAPAADLDARLTTDQGSADLAAANQAAANLATPAVVESVAAGPDSCPDGWYCLFENPDFTGRMLKLRDPEFWQDLDQWHFRLQASAWRNRLQGRGVQNTTQLAGGTLEFLWCAAPGRSGSLAGSAADDVTTHLYVDPTGTIC